MPVVPSNPALRQMIKAAMKGRAPEMYDRLSKAGNLEREIDDRVAIAREAQIAAITQATMASWERAMTLAMEFGPSRKAPETASPQPARAGFDPELLAMGIQMAGFHMEAGAYRFVDLAKIIAADLETTLDKIRPYLRGWYNGARDMLEDSGINVDGMDSPDAVKAALVSFDAMAPAANPEKVEEETDDAGSRKRRRASAQVRSPGGDDRLPDLMNEHVRLLAGDLVEALKSARPRKTKKHKAVPVSLTLSPSKTELLIVEARHGRFEYTVPATGTLTTEVQVDGALVHKIARSYDPSGVVDLIVGAGSFAVAHGKSRSTIPRIDGPQGKRIKRTAPRPNPLHKGKPDGADSPLRPSVPQNKTWGFSAHFVRPEKKK